MEDLRYHTCTPGNPWKPELNMRGIHPEAVEGDNYDDWETGISCVRYHCPICGTRWTQELPQ